ncbi:hypothetical protein K488DRAFT_70636 [Vararia minispora EC-137]|uniref:Uncharacterized protein n=1 Tax=Vararia minispora EC-137 TaxID=1314806 RepID=A0ACB8QLH3_9AGAM|nr:hypothetical protein K488DRAFT_70636 [Vararia minispora EC-137]
MKTFIASVLAVLSTSRAALAVNDWSTPCHAGQCAWHMPSSETSSSSVMHIWGAPLAIADITPAAGWSILACSATLASQVVRVACTDPNAECGHLLDAEAVGRIVRLPDECGPAPFATITAMTVSVDQNVPRHLYRRGLPSPKVYALTLSSEFGTYSPHGPVVNESVRHPSRSIAQHRELQMKRRFVDDGVHSFLAARQSTNSNPINFDKVTTFPPLNINQTGNVFNVSVSNCQVAGVPFNAAVSADATAVASATVSLGISVTGQLLPVPTLDTAAITAGLTGSVNGSLHIVATADGTFSSPDLTLLDVPLPGFVGIPGVLDIGPTFRIVANADLNLGVGVDTVLGLSYAVDNATLVFPPTAGASSGNFSPANTPLSLSTDTNATGDASITAHVIPQLSVGLNVFGNNVAATVTLALDASATLNLNGTAGVRTQTGSAAVILPPTGCVDVSAGLDVTAAADATLFSIFQAGDSVSLFSNTFDLFNTCGTADVSGFTAGNNTNSTASFSNSTVSSSNSTASSSNSTNSSSSNSTSTSTSSNTTSSADACIAMCSSYGLLSSVQSGTVSASSAAASSTSSSYASSSSSYASSSSSYNSYGSSSSSSGYGSGSSSYRARAKRAPTRTRLTKRVAFSCPSLPFSIVSPAAPTNVTPAAKGAKAAARR